MTSRITASLSKPIDRAYSPEDRSAQRRPLPTLSDRAMESLSSIPPSPSPTKRRQSGFFTSESPMAPVSRTTSAVGNSRPASQMSFGNASRSTLPPSPSKKAIQSHGRTQSTVPTSIIMAPLGTKRVVSGGSSLRGPTSMQTPQIASRLGKPITGLTKSTAGNRLSFIGSKTMTGRLPAAKSPVKEIFGEPLSKPSTKSNLVRSSTLAYRQPAASNRAKVAASRSVKSPTQDIEQASDNDIDKKIAHSSQSLRNTIQQARQRMVKKSGNSFVPRAVEEDNLQTFGIDMDPRFMDMQDSAHINIIRKRINMAKTDGKLNISMLCLKEMPAEVLEMYEAGNDDGGPSWYESVDVTRLNAADNEFTTLPDHIFARPVSADDEAIERDSSTGIFIGLESIDFHTNQLKQLPLSLGTLSQLTSLNLSRNQLECDSIEILSFALNLKELRISQNRLKGMLPSSIGNLQSLEILDLHGNAISEFPRALGKLSHLKLLNVSDNQLTALPMEAIFDLHLVEIDASRNKLSDVLIPANVALVPYLQKLKLSFNALTSLTNSKVDFPLLQHLDISNNRVSALPNVQAWEKLTFLNAEENKISEIPAGFTSLKELIHADFGNNSLLELDDLIGSMDSLVTLNIANNPVRERRLPKLTTEELKMELRGRGNGMVSPGSDRTGLTSHSSTFAQAMVWTVVGDSLDRANWKLKTIEKMDLEPLVHENIRQVILHHNQLATIPQSLSLLGSSLTTLDLSNNKLHKGTPFLPESLALPHLQTLNLTLNGLLSLDSLVQNLQAAKLATLIVTFNKLTTLPISPALTSVFPALTKLVATNNKIVSLDVDALRGLQVLDVSSNEIEALSPQLALLEGTLRTLMINGNKFRVPSWGVLEKGTEEILKWCRRQIPRGQEGAMEAAW